LRLIVVDMAAPVPALWIEAGEIADAERRTTLALRRDWAANYADIVHSLAAAARDLLQHPTEIPGIIGGILWSALNHPTVGGAIRVKLSDELALRNKAVLTWRYDPECGGLALAVGQSVLDMTTVLAIMAAAPIGSVISGAVGDGDGDSDDPPRRWN
jgi:hypothetical protein